MYTEKFLFSCVLEWFVRRCTNRPKKPGVITISIRLFAHSLLSTRRTILPGGPGCGFPRRSASTQSRLSLSPIHPFLHTLLLSHEPHPTQPASRWKIPSVGGILPCSSSLTPEPTPPSCIHPTPAFFSHPTFQSRRASEGASERAQDKQLVMRLILLIIRQQGRASGAEVEVGSCQSDEIAGQCFGI